MTSIWKKSNIYKLDNIVKNIIIHIIAQLKWSQLM